MNNALEQNHLECEKVNGQIEAEIITLHAAKLQELQYEVNYLEFINFWKVLNCCSYGL